MGWYRETEIASTRKPHRCESCLALIPAGSSALYVSLHDSYNDYPFYGHFHAECRAAEIALNDARGFQAGDEWCPLHEADREDREWLADAHPVALARLSRAA